MKKTAKLICALLLCGIAGTAQAQKETTYVQKYQNSQARLLDVTTNTYTKPLVVEFEPLSTGELTGMAGKLNSAGNGREYKVTGNTSSTEKGRNKGRVEGVIRMSKSKVETELKGDVTEIRKWGTFQVIKDFNADVLLGPLFDIKTSDNGDYYELTVIGFPARFTNWRELEQGDYNWINLENASKVSDNEKTKAIVK